MIGHRSSLIQATGLAILLLAVTGPSASELSASGQPAPSAQDRAAIEAGQQALRGFPWYDAETDALKRVAVEPPPPPLPPSAWQPTAPQPAAPTAGPSFLDTLLQILPWVLLIGLLVAALYLIARYLVLPQPAGAEKSKKGAAGKKSEIERLAALPFDVDRPVDDLLAETQRQYENGNFSAAIIYLYSFLLVELDRHHRIRLEKGKTNRQYLREIRPRPELQPVFEETMIAFEEVFFGHRQLDRPRFEACWQMVPQFRAQLTK